MRGRVWSFTRSGCRTGRMVKIMAVSTAAKMPRVAPSGRGAVLQDLKPRQSNPAAVAMARVTSSRLMMAGLLSSRVLAAQQAAMPMLSRARAENQVTTLTSAPGHTRGNRLTTRAAVMMVGR